MTTWTTAATTPRTPRHRDRGDVELDLHDRRERRPLGKGQDHQARCRWPASAIPGQGPRAYFAILKSPGQRPASLHRLFTTATPAESSGVLSSLPRQFGRYSAASFYHAPGGIRRLRDSETSTCSTNMLFYARHPEVPSGTRDTASPASLADDRRRIRDQVIVPLLKTMGVTSASNGGSSAALAPDAVQRVERWAALSDPVAKANGVDPNFVLGLIAAESGGDPKLKAGSRRHRSDAGGAHQGRSDADAIGAGRQRRHRGTQTGAVSRPPTYRKILQKHGRSFASLARLDGLKMLALCYNAGPVTVAKALDYAVAAGTLDALAGGGTLPARPALHRRLQHRSGGRDFVLAARIPARGNN